jgi:hypothetical protein
MDLDTDISPHTRWILTQLTYSAKVYVYIKIYVYICKIIPPHTVQIVTIDKYFLIFRDSSERKKRNNLHTKCD